MRIAELCAGYGGLTSALLEIFPESEISFFADNDPHASRILETRYPGIPNLGDITAIDWGGDARGSLADIDILAAGFPLALPGCFRRWQAERAHPGKPHRIVV